MTDPNAGPACTPGRLLHITLYGTFPHIAYGGASTDAAGHGHEDITAVLLTVDAATGKPCLMGVHPGATTPDPGAVLLFTN